MLQLLRWQWQWERCFVLNIGHNRTAKNDDTNKRNGDDDHDVDRTTISTDNLRSYHDPIKSYRWGRHALAHTLIIITFRSIECKYSHANDFHFDIGECKMQNAMAEKTKAKMRKTKAFRCFFSPFSHDWSIDIVIIVTKIIEVAYSIVIVNASGTPFPVSLLWSGTLCWATSRQQSASVDKCVELSMWNDTNGAGVRSWYIRFVVQLQVSGCSTHLRSHMPIYEHGTTSIHSHTWCIFNVWFYEFLQSTNTIQKSEGGGMCGQANERSAAERKWKSFSCHFSHRHAANFLCETKATKCWPYHSISMHTLAGLVREMCVCCRYRYYMD